MAWIRLEKMISRPTSLPHSVCFCSCVCCAAGEGLIRPVLTCEFNGSLLQDLKSFHFITTKATFHSLLLLYLSNVADVFEGKCYRN